MFQRKICASLVLVLGLVALPALAQQRELEQHHPPAASPAATAAPNGGMSGGAMPGMGGMPMMGMMRMMMGQDGMGSMPMMAAVAGHVEGRLAFLKTELKITDTQLPLWNAVADAIRANAKSMGEMSGGMMGSSQTATLPDKLAMREKMMTAHLDALHRFKAAIEPLYAALSDEQKKTADELLMGPMGMM
jgi:LTXXQ motif family protein